MARNRSPARSVTLAIRRAEHHLAQADPIMKRLIAKHGHCPIAEREFQPFHMLANSIISQQLSTNAAATIKQRVGVLVGVPFETSKVLSTSIEKLRGAGLSWATIFISLGDTNRYQLSDDALAQVRNLLATEPRGRGFGNARFVRNLFETAVSHQAMRLAPLADPSDEQLVTLTAADIASVDG